MPPPLSEVIHHGFDFMFVFGKLIFRGLIRDISNAPPRERPAAVIAYLTDCTRPTEHCPTCC